MLIINADDYGRSKRATDNILHCYRSERINSASGMVFMADSERSAELALGCNLDVGLHVNFTERFSGRVPAGRLIAHQGKIAAFLKTSRFALLFFNPLLVNSFDYVFRSQFIEYTRLFKKPPNRVDGHEHMHLCTNMILRKIIPNGTMVRRNFSFFDGEKSTWNRAYRSIVDVWLQRRYVLRNYFFGMSGNDRSSVLGKAIELARVANVELMVHPERDGEFKYLAGEEYWGLISKAKINACGKARDVGTNSAGR